MITAISSSPIRKPVGTPRESPTPGNPADDYLGSLTPIQKSLVQTTREIATHFARSPEACAALRRATLATLAGATPPSSLSAALLSTLDAYLKDSPDTREGLRMGGQLLTTLSDLPEATAGAALLGSAADWATNDDAWHPLPGDALSIRDGKAVQRRAMERLDQGVSGDGRAEVIALGLEVPLLCQRPDDARAIDGMLLRQLSDNSELAARAESALGRRSPVSDASALAASQEAFKILGAPTGGQDLTRLTGELAARVYANPSVAHQDADWIGRILLHGSADAPGAEGLAARVALNSKPEWFGGYREEPQKLDPATRSGLQQRVAQHLAEGNLRGELAPAVLQIWNDCRASASGQELRELGSNLLTQFANQCPDQDLKSIADFALRHDAVVAFEAGSWKRADDPSVFTGDLAKLERTFDMVQAAVTPEASPTASLRASAQAILQDVEADPRARMEARIRKLDVQVIDKPGGRGARLARGLGEVGGCVAIAGMVASIVTGSAALGLGAVALGIGSSLAGGPFEGARNEQGWAERNQSNYRGEAQQLQRMLDAGQKSAEVANRVLTGSGPPAPPGAAP